MCNNHRLYVTDGHNHYDVTSWVICDTNCYVELKHIAT